MHIIEQFVEGKTKDSTECEDGIFVSDHFVAVIDGASSKTQVLYDGKKTGLIARDLVNNALATLPADADARHGFGVLNRALYAWYESHHISDLMRKKPYERCAASVALYSENHRELWMVGDCQALVGTEHITNTKYIDTVSDAARAAFIEGEVRKGVAIDALRENDTGRAFIQPLLDRQNYFQNTRGGTVFDYEVLDGFFTDDLPIKITSIPADTKEIVLASDGYPALMPSLSDSEAALAKILADDPLLFRVYRSPKGHMHGTNSYDDRAYVRFVP